MIDALQHSACIHISSQPSLLLLTKGAAVSEAPVRRLWCVQVKACVAYARYDFKDWEGLATNPSICQGNKGLIGLVVQLALLLQLFGGRRGDDILNMSFMHTTLEHQPVDLDELNFVGPSPATLLKFAMALNKVITQLEHAVYTAQHSLLVLQSYILLAEAARQCITTQAVSTAHACVPAKLYICITSDQNAEGFCCTAQTLLLLGAVEIFMTNNKHAQNRLR